MANRTVIVIGSDGKEEPLKSTDTATDSSGTAIGGGGGGGSATDLTVQGNAYKRTQLATGHFSVFNSMINLAKNTDFMFISSDDFLGGAIAHTVVGNLSFENQLNALQSKKQDQGIQRNRTTSIAYPLTKKYTQSTALNFTYNFSSANITHNAHSSVLFKLPLFANTNQTN